MDTLKIKYCNNNGFLIKNNRNKFKILSKINKILGYNVIDNNHKIYSDRLIHSLKNRHMLATYLSTGKSCCLFLTEIYGELTSIIIEKNSNDKNLYPKIITVSLHFNKELYNDTLFSTELYRSNNNCWYLILDSLLMYKGNKTEYSNINNIKMINKAVKEMKYYPIDLCKVIAKKFVKPSDIQNLVDKTNINLKGLKFINRFPIHFYFNKKYITYSNKTNLVNLPSDFSDIIREKIKELNIETDTSITNTVSTMKSPKFILELRKTDVYGVYDLFAKKNQTEYEDMGIGRIETIEISNEIINKLRLCNKFNVIADYSYNFSKFRVLEITKNRNISKSIDIKTSI